MISLRDKVVIVTGASSGIGLATANYDNGQYTNGSSSNILYTHKYDHTFDGCLSLRKL